MVCDRCIMVVRQQLEALNFEVKELALGEVEISPEPDKSSLERIRQQFLAIGFELIESKKSILTEKIKTLIIEKINKEDGAFEYNLSEYLSTKIGLDYHYLTHVFSETTSTTIEKFVIQKKVESVKKMLREAEFNISEIAWKVGYSSVQALSNQFKKVTGKTPSEYKNQAVFNKTIKK